MRVKRRLAAVAIAVAALQLPGCGYLIFPERTGQPAGQVDWSVVGLDAVGLLFGIVPGVVAFAVDLATGCIYLPPPPFAAAEPASAAAAPRHPAEVRNWRAVGYVPVPVGAMPATEAVAELLRSEGVGLTVDGRAIRWQSAQ